MLLPPGIQRCRRMFPSAITNLINAELCKSMDLHSGLTPLGPEPAATRPLLAAVLRSTRACTCLIVICWCNLNHSQWDEVVSWSNISELAIEHETQDGGSSFKADPQDPKQLGQGCLGKLQPQHATVGATIRYK